MNTNPTSKKPVFSKNYKVSNCDRKPTLVLVQDAKQILSTFSSKLNIQLVNFSATNKYTRNNLITDLLRCLELCNHKNYSINLTSDSLTLSLDESDVKIKIVIFSPNNCSLEVEIPIFAVNNLPDGFVNTTSVFESHKKLSRV